MEEVFLVFEGDAWLSSSSLVPMGVFENYECAVENIMEKVEEAIENGSEDNDCNADNVRDYLQSNAQTPTLRTNYIIKTAKLNQWGEI